MMQLPPLPMEEFEKELTLMDNKYPFAIPDKVTLACLIIGGIHFNNLCNGATLAVH